MGRTHTILRLLNPSLTVVSNQTGNTVLFAVTAFSLFGTRQETNFTVPTAHIGTSLGFFCLGVFTAGQVSNFLACKSTRCWLLSTNLLQTTLVLLATLINLINRTPNNEIRDVNSATIPTTQATAAYVDLFVDPNFFASITGNRSRNRRIAFLVTLCVGSFIGAPAYHYVSTAFTILLAGIVKVSVALLFFLNRTEKPSREKSVSGP